MNAYVVYILSCEWIIGTIFIKRTSTLFSFNKLFHAILCNKNTNSSLTYRFGSVNANFRRRFWFQQIKVARITQLLMRWAAAGELITVRAGWRRQRADFAQRQSCTFVLTHLLTLRSCGKSRHANTIERPTRKYLRETNWDSRRTRWLWEERRRRGRRVCVSRGWHWHNNIMHIKHRQTLDMQIDIAFLTACRVDFFIFLFIFYLNNNSWCNLKK